MTNIRFIKVSNTYEVRVTVTDAAGRRRDIRRRAKTTTDAKSILKDLNRSLDDYGPAMIDGERLTFASLADTYTKRRLQEPTYKGETRVSGLRSWKIQRQFLKPLIAYFGNRRIRTITHSDIEEYKRERYATPIRRMCKSADGVARWVDAGERGVVGVNRELSLLRGLFSFAKKSGWLVRSPFEMGESLISTADEQRRDRILTFDEEVKLLAACDGKRAHLRPLVICAIDTAMRRSEMFRLEWKDIDLRNGVINVRKTTTKTWESRKIGITARLRREFERLITERRGYCEGSVFGVGTTIKHSFATACRLAGIENLHLHDLRHTATTRMINSGLPPAKVCKITGHRQMATFLRYVNVDDHGAREGAASLDDLYSRSGMESQDSYVN